MKIIDVEQNSDAWFEARKGKITGSKLKDLTEKRGGGKKIGYYELIAEKLAISPDEEDPRERGHRLETEAVELLKEKTGLDFVESGIWVSDEHENIACSPDCAVLIDGKFKIAGEMKALSSARHMEAYLTQQIPDEYEYQKIQYFIVNKDLEKLYFCFYDPRIPAIPFFYIEVNRSDIEEDIKTLTAYQLNLLKEVDEIVNNLSF